MDNNDSRLREHLANERTFLAWVRTSVALIGLGFLIVKFAFFLNEVTILFQTNKMLAGEQFSALAGVVIVVFGVLLLPFAFFQYKKVEKQINRFTYKSSSLLSGLLTVAIIAGGILLIVHLLSSIEI